MSTVMIGAAVAVFKDDQVLLTKREDFEVWCLPGGHLEPGESAAQGAIREVREETGLDVALIRLVGVYTFIDSARTGHVITFTARPTGGQLRPQADEVIDIGYFAQETLPDDMLWWHRQRVLDAFAGVGGGVATLTPVKTSRPYTSRQDLYALRDRSELSRSAFYRQFFEPDGPGWALREVG